MEAKEKAKELIEKYHLTQDFEWTKNEELLNISSDINKNTEVENYWLKLAKQCAIIAVEEIIKTVNMCIPYHNEETNVDFWSEVKIEIENL